VVAQDAAARQKEVARVERIVLEEADAFAAWQAGQAAASLIASLRGRFQRARQEQLDRAGTRLARMSPAAREVALALTASLVNKLLHTPSVRLRCLASSGDGKQHAETIQGLLGAAEKAEEPPEPCRPT